MIVINLFAGPGCGKSTLASYIFYLLKKDGYNAELVTEYAKELTWEENFDKLSDQLYVTSKQNRKLSRLKNKVDIVVTDCPLLLGIHYATPEYIGGHFEPMVYSLFETYNNYNIFLERVKPYRKVGRTQTEDEARNIDKSIKKILDDHNYKYITTEGSSEGIDKIYKDIVSLLEE